VLKKIPGGRSTPEVGWAAHQLRGRGGPSRGQSGDQGVCRVLAGSGAVQAAGGQGAQGRLVDWSARVW